MTASLPKLSDSVVGEGRDEVASTKRNSREIFTGKTKGRKTIQNSGASGQWTK